MLKKQYIFFSLLILIGIISFAQIKPISLFPDTIGICQGDSFLIKFPDEQVGKTANYQWTTPYSLIFHTKQLYVKSKGRYIVKISDDKKTLIDTTYIRLFERPKVNFKDTFLCSGSNLVIQTKNKLYDYTWNNGETSEKFKIDKPGKYWVNINNSGCIYTDTFRVLLANGVIPNFAKELLICENETNKTLSVKAPSDVKLFWNNGSNSSAINVTKDGVYWVKSTSKNCGIKTDSVTVKYKNCECEMYIPNSFTPNDDDRNDLFSPIFQCEYSYFLFTIYDRWGNTVYTSTNINAKWDGKFKSNPCPDDVYVYRIDAIQKNNDKKIIRNGHISLFR